MWWEPRTENEAALARVLRGLEKGFLASVADEQVHGVGSLLFNGRLHPLLLLNPERVEAPVAVGVPLTRADLPDGVVPDWPLPQHGFYLFASRPRALSAPATPHGVSGTRIRCTATGQTATLGLPLIRNRSSSIDAFLTAGHFTRPHAVIELVVSRYGLRTSQHRIGRVIAHNDPTCTSTPGYDYAIVELDAGATVAGPGSSGVWSVTSPLTQPQLCTLHGAVAGSVANLGLIGALTLYGGVSGIWKNSWLLVPSGIVAQGDSGAPLITAPGSEAAAMLIGGSCLGSSSVFIAQYAQDLASLENDVLSPAGFRI